MVGVYVIRNATSGRLYVGGSRRVRQRWAEHRSALRGGYHRNAGMQADWNAYGEGSFSVALLEPISDATLLHDREVWWIGQCQHVYRSALYNAYCAERPRPMREDLIARMVHEATAL